MALKTFVKVGSITNLSDARYCAGMGVDLLGFRVVPGQENHINPKQFQEIRGWVTGPKIVAEVYGLTHVDQLTEIIENYRPDFLELGKKELLLLKGQASLPIILSIDTGETLDSINDEPAFILVRERSDLAQLANDYEILLTVESIENVQRIDQQYIHGIALSGSAEIKPGLKQYNELSEILEMLEDEN
ncbi:MAG TPA: N-(5'-phosphoribosyl)anthranilate isomerase [Ohtaekwangia sp.]|uniref:N-(5'-phosphoribosyl)anthranilate isomerase n=1 Tax=Ohtaekwangia sp. TaxID=2066019 RepID=UPI002F92AF7E